MSALVSYNVMRWLCFLLLILLLSPILGATPLLATDVIVTAVPNYVAVPTVVTDNETSVSHTWGYVCANITDIGTATPTVRGFEWDTNSGEPYTWSWYETGSFSEGGFCHNITGLGCNETYYFRGFATSSDGTGYGDEESFTTPVCVSPTVDSSAATDITNNAGVVHGSITSTGGANAHTRGFEWGFSMGNYTQSWNETGSFGIGAFSHTVGNLTLATEVFFRAFAINTIGTGYSGEESFTTLELPLAPTDFTISEAGPISINITWIMGVGANTTVIRGSSDGYPTSVTDGYEVYNGNGTSVEITDLNLDSGVYYYTAWSHNAYGYSLDYARANTGIGGTNMIMFVLLILPLSFTGFYLWKRDIWQGIVACLCWVAAAIFFMSQSAGATPFEVADIWMVLFWICMVLAIVFALSPFVWKTTKEELWEEGEDEQGQPMMVQYVKGNETSRTRDLTDIEVRNREQRIKEQQEGRVKRKIKPSNFAQNGKIS